VHVLCIVQTIDCNEFFNKAEGKSSMNSITTPNAQSSRAYTSSLNRILVQPNRSRQVKVNSQLAAGVLVPEIKWRYNLDALDSAK